MNQLSRTAMLWVASLAVLGFTQANAEELVTNGSFGNIVVGQVAVPSTTGWQIQVNGQNTTDVKIYNKNAGCTPESCVGEQKAIFQCTTFPAGANSFPNFYTQTLAKKLRPSTRYRLSYVAFTDNTLPIQSIGVVGAYLSLHDASFAQMHGVQMFPKFASLDSLDVAKLLAEPTIVEFVTPVSADTMNIPVDLNIYSTSVSTLGSRACIGNISLTDVVALSPDSVKVAVNGFGYAATGPKVATLVLPSGKTNAGAYRAVLMQGNAVASLKSDVTESGFQPSPPSTSFSPYLLNIGAVIVDPDSGDVTAPLDFSNFEPASSVTTAVINKIPYFRRLKTIVTTTTTLAISPEDYWIKITDANGAEIAKSPKFKMIGSGGWAYGSNSLIKTDALNALKSQRSGARVPYMVTGNNIPGRNFGSFDQHAASHEPDTATCWVGTDDNGVATSKDLHGNDWGNGGAGCVSNGSKKTFDVTGGWYDAADHGKYVVNGAFTLWALQNQIERLQNNGKLAQFPGLMEEAKFEMAWLLKMQVPDGMIMKVPLGNQDKVQLGPVFGPTGTTGVYQVDLTGQAMPPTSPGAVDFGGGKIPRLRIKLQLSEVDVGGMVFQSVHDQNWTGIPQDPSKDTQPRVLRYPTTAATLDLAAVAAQCSRIWKNVDANFAAQCLGAATKAFKKAKSFRTGTDDATIAINSDILAYEFSNKNWSTVDPSGTTETSKKNGELLKNGFAENPMFNGGGAYGDLRVGDEFYWAGTELTLAMAAYGTPDNQYLSYGTSVGVINGNDPYGQYSTCVQQTYPIQCYAWINGFDWQNVSALGTLSLLTYDTGRLAPNTDARDHLLSVANSLVAQTNAQAYRFPKKVDVRNSSTLESNRDAHYEWGSNGNVLNRAIILAAAADQESEQSKKAPYVNAVVSTMDYLLGRNALGVSYISGYGSNAVYHPHHRWYANGADLSKPQVPPGYLVGGPNSRDIPALRANASRYETPAQALYGRTHGDPAAVVGGISDASQRYFEENVVSKCVNEKSPYGAVYLMQKCYADDYRSFATNEVAVNWNASLIWVTQFLSETYW